MKERRALALAAAVVAVVVAIAGYTAFGAAGDGDGEGAMAPTPDARPADPGLGIGETPSPPARETPTLPAGGTPLPGRDTPAPGRTPTPGSGAGQATVRVLAPIDAAGITVLESFPPQYRLQVKAGLPSGCARADGYELSRSGNEIRIAVYNTLPAGNPVCTAIYGQYDLSISLGSNFTSGQDYVVNVNGTVVTFRAQ
ncbi:MAG TPA: hypothetical protein VNN10_00645 [Dehalococcoidia bacterium]|nr:hypothetical protein [Dehalococcoidia bacterium]